MSASGPSPPRLPALLLAVAAIYLAALFGAAVRIHVRASIAGAPGQPTLSIGQKRVSMTTAFDLAESRLQLTHLGPAAEVRVVRIRTIHQGQLARDEFTRETGDWRFVDDAIPGETVGTLVASEPGSRISWRGVTGGLVVDVAGGPAKLELDWNGRPREVDVTPAARSVRLPSPRRMFLAQVSPWAGNLRFEAPPAAEAELTVLFGNDVLVSRVVPAGGRAEVVVGWAERGRLLGQMAGHLLRLALRTIVLLAAYFLAGLVVIAAALPRLAPVERLWVPIAIGFCLLGVTVTSLAYALPVGIGFPLVAAALLVTGVVLHRGRTGTIARSLRAALADDGWRLPAASAVLGAVVMFFPAALEGEWYLAHAYTDVWFYTLHPQEYLHAPMLTVTPHGGMLRFGEIVSLAVSTLLLHTDSRRMFAVEGIALWTTAPFVVGSLLQRLDAGAAVARTFAVLAAFSAGWFCIFSQGYFAHYLFSFVLAWALHMTIVCLQETDRAVPSERRALWTATAVTYAFNVASYPFQFLLPPCWALALLLRRTTRRAAARWRELAVVGVLAALFVNASFSVILMYPTVAANFGHWEHVNGVARNWVFTFWNRPQMLLVTYGLRDTVLNARFFTRIGVQMFDGHRTHLNLAGAIYHALGWPCLAGALTLTAIGLVACLRSPRPERLLTGLVPVAFLAFFAYSGASGQTYAYGKIGMTLGTLVLPIIGVGMAVAWDAAGSRAWARPLLGVWAVLFLALNLISTGLETADSFLNRKSNLLYEMRTHLPSVDVELKTLVAFLEAERAREGRPIAVRTECRVGDWHHTDRDVVLERRIAHVAVVVADGLTAPPGSPGYVVRFAQSGCGDPRPDAPVLATRLFTVYRDPPAAPSP